MRHSRRPRCTCEIAMRRFHEGATLLFSEDPSQHRALGRGGGGMTEELLGPGTGEITSTLLPTLAEHPWIALASHFLREVSKGL